MVVKVSEFALIVNLNDIQTYRSGGVANEFTLRSKFLWLHLPNRSIFLCYAVTFQQFFLSPVYICWDFDGYLNNNISITASV